MLTRVECLIGPGQIPVADEWHDQLALGRVVAESPLMGGVDRVIDLGQEFIGIVRLRTLRLEHVTRGVRQRYVLLENIASGWIEARQRNPPAGKGGLRVGIYWGNLAGRKISAALRCRRDNRGVLEHLLIFAQSRVAAEEKRLVAADRPSEA